MAKIALGAAATAGMITADVLTGGATAALHPWLVPLIEGASIGLAVGAALIPPKIPGIAPLQDLQVSSSADGAPIPFGYGMSGFAGQVIWSPGIIYQKSMPASTGKGGGNQGAVYVYMAGFAVAFCEGPAIIDRVWADSKLIYKGGNDFGTVSVWNATTPYVEDDLVTYTFYPGIGGRSTQIYRCILANTNIVPNGNALYWEIAPYSYWDHTVQYQPGNEVVYPGLTSEVAQAGTVYVCVNPSLNDRPPSSPLHWETTTAYYQTPTLYPGDQIQQPDPIIQSVEGIARTPGFRGLAYGVWELMPLANFGNRVPNLRAEVTFCSTNPCG